MGARAAETETSRAWGGRNAPASPVFWRRLMGENGVQKWAFYIPALFMIVFLVLPIALTLVFIPSRRTVVLTS